MGIGLPDNGEYIEGSWEVDWDIVEDDENYESNRIGRTKWKKKEFVITVEGIAHKPTKSED